MTTRERSFLEMDAGEQREFLASELADWIEAEFWSSSRAATFYRRVKILAASIGETFVEIMEILNADADAIVAARAGTTVDR